MVVVKKKTIKRFLVNPLFISVYPYKGIISGGRQKARFFVENF
jgi:hypothetical protein